MLNLDALDSGMSHILERGPRYATKRAGTSSLVGAVARAGGQKGGNMWDTLGFTKNPYDAQPLRADKRDVDLLIGREEESVKFSTLVESSDHGTVLLSGLPGVGKTSFFNVQQYLMESGETVFGKKLLPAIYLCPVNSDDTATSLALRILHNTCKNVFEFCSSHNHTIPDKVQITFDWLNGRGGVGVNLSLQAWGFGGGIGKTSQTVAASGASAEMLQQVLATISSEIIEKFDFEGIFVALDNFENLEEAQLSNVLMTFRDTFFTLPKTWWVVIGQTGLTSLIQVLDPRVGCVIK